jgi:hypothetical protein
MADNPIEHSRTKHIDILYHFLRDHQQKGDIEIAYVSTHNQLADIFTKPLDEKTFSKLKNELNILDSQNFDWNIAHIAHVYAFDHVSLIWYKCIFFILLVAKAKTNVLSSVILSLVLYWKGNGIYGKDKAYTPTLTVSSTLCRYSYNSLLVRPFTHIYFTIWENVLGPKGGEKCEKGSQVLRFWRLMPKGGESIKPKAKEPQDRTTISKLSKMFISIDI